jgi:hypothetical protein
MVRPRRRLAATLLVLGAERAHSQKPASAPDTLRRDANPIVVGSPQDDRRRTLQLLGVRELRGALMRSASATPIDTTVASGEGLQWRLLRPQLDLTWNSGMAFSLNDGPQWTGRGLSAAFGGGLRASVGRAHLILLPQVWTTANEGFPVLPGLDPQRSSFASPWHAGLISADLPQRFGYRRTTAFDLGESAAWIILKGVSAGVATESQWWGPGVRNALLMSNNAGGIPHAFVRTPTPIRTRAGDFEAKWMIGTLTESRFFDSDSLNDLRSLSGAVVTFTPIVEPNLTVGAARVVYARIPGVGALPARALDAFGRWGEGANLRAARYGRAAEQLTSLFGRWVFPASSAEVYGEWGRIVLPASLKSMLVAPQFTQGFTIGLQWLPEINPEARLRLHLEMTNLEQSPASRSADTLSFYVSSVVPQGYTHRGQVIGAAIGPGSSSQWLALDYLRGERSAGVFAGRIRWDTDAYYTQPTSVVYLAYDVSIFAGLRAAARILGRETAAEFWLQQRYNYLFQNPDYGYSRDGAFDKRIVTAKLRFY